MSVDLALPPRHFLGLALRALREEAAVSQDELHRRTGVAQSTIDACERGTRSTGYDTIARLARGLGVALSALIARAETIETFHAGRR